MTKHTQPVDSKGDGSGRVRVAGLPAHSPAPWQISGSCAGVVDRSGNAVAVVSARNAPGDCRLIAAAPDLLAAAKAEGGAP